MIILGIKSVHIKTVRSNLGICSSCLTQGSLTISVFRKYIYVCWIPILPIGRKGISECNHCNRSRRVR